MRRKLSIVVGALSLAVSVGNAAAVELAPIPDAFARLGHSCGGIKQQIFGEGFDADHHVTGYVFVVTRCGGSGKGGGYHTTTYSAWLAVTWDLTGAVIDETPAVPDPDPSIAGAYHSGSLVGGVNYPNCDNATPYDNAFTCVSNPVLDDAGAYAVRTSLYVVNQAACTASDTTYCTYRATLTACDPTCSHCGDADANGAVTASDALAALRAAVGAGSCALQACDVDDSGDVTVDDALIILEHTAGENVALSCP